MKEIFGRSFLLFLLLFGLNGALLGQNKCYSEEQLDKLILRSRYTEARRVAEKMMACYKNEKPPADLYVRLAIIYLNLGEHLKASDILKILSSEYKLDEYQKWMCKQLSHALSSIVVLQLGAFSKMENALKFSINIENGLNLKCFIKKENGLYKVRLKVPLTTVDRVKKELWEKWGVKCRQIS